MSSIIRAKSIANGENISVYQGFFENEVVDMRQQEIDKMIEQTVSQNTEQQVINEKQKQADQLLEEARKEAAKLIEQANAEAKQILDEANQVVNERMQQLEVKEQEVLEKANKKIKQEEKRQQQLIQQIKEELEEDVKATKKNMLQELEENLVECIKLLVSHIVAYEVTTSHRWIECLVAKMVQEENLLEKIVLHLSYNNYQEMIKDKGYQKIAKDIELVADTHLTDTTVKVETEHGNVVYDISEGLKQSIKDVSVLAAAN